MDVKGPLKGALLERTSLPERDNEGRILIDKGVNRIFVVINGVRHYLATTADVNSGSRSLPTPTALAEPQKFYVGWDSQSLSVGSYDVSNFTAFDIPSGDTELRVVIPSTTADAKLVISLPGDVNLEEIQISGGPFIDVFTRLGVSNGRTWYRSNEDLEHEVTQNRNLFVDWGA